MDSEDGANFYARESIPTALYEPLFDSPSIAGDVEYYEDFCRRAGPRILDAACGTGRIARALARPWRRLVAFDASAYFIERLKLCLIEAPPRGPIAVRRDRLESFELAQRFDGIILSYYCFNHLLTAPDRDACFRRLSRHLGPGGLIVLQVPRADLLTRTVPEHEIAALCFESTLPDPGGASAPGRPSRSIRQEVRSMEYDADRSIRQVRYRFALLEDGVPLRVDHLTMQYAALLPDDIAALAERHGIRINRQFDGFQDEVDSECIFEMERL